MPTFNRQQVLWKTCSMKQSIKQQGTWLTLTIIMVINEKHVASARSHLLMCCIAYECFVDLKLVYGITYSITSEAHDHLVLNGVR